MMGQSKRVNRSQLDQLGIAAVALSGWTWKANMRVKLAKRSHTGVPAGTEVQIVGLRRRRVWDVYHRGEVHPVQQACLGGPDLRCVATGGIMLEMVGPRVSRVDYSRAVYVYVDGEDGCVASGMSVGEAAVVAAQHIGGVACRRMNPRPSAYSNSCASG